MKGENIFAVLFVAWILIMVGLYFYSEYIQNDMDIKFCEDNGWEPYELERSWHRCSKIINDTVFIREFEYIEGEPYWVDV